MNHCVYDMYMLVHLLRYLELRCAITFYYRSHFYTNKGRIGWLDIIEHSYLYLMKNYTDNKML